MNTSLIDEISDREAVEIAFSCDFLYNARSCIRSSVINWLAKVQNYH